MIEFLDFARGASTLLAAGSSSFATIYGTIEGTSLAKKQAKLQSDLLQNRSALEDEILNVQKNIFLDQQETAQKSNEIDIKIKNARADLELQKIENEFEKLNSKSNQETTNTNEKSNKIYYLVGGAFVFLSAAFFLRKNNNVF